MVGESSQLDTTGHNRTLRRSETKYASPYHSLIRIDDIVSTPLMQFSKVVMVSQFGDRHRIQVHLGTQN